MTNIALRRCVDVDPYLVSAVKAGPTVVLLAPLVGWQALMRQAPPNRGQTEPRPRVPRRRVGQFVVAAFLAQFFGNAAFQKALQHIGLAASVPITLGTLIVGGAVLGAVLLGEAVGRRKAVAMVTLIAAVVVLSLPHDAQADRGGPGVGDPAGEPAGDAIEPENRQAAAAERAVEIVVGSLWASISGFAYGFFGVTMRQTLRAGSASTHLMLISGVIGTITLWSFCWVNMGAAQIAATPMASWWTMIAAGVFNFSAFVAITTALKLLPVVAVNLINASQVAMASLAGVLLFREPVTLQLVLGILLTFVGLMILARRTRAPIVITD
jgi:drug/metabolite transporter (DMT)-like permease